MNGVIKAQVYGIVATILFIIFLIFRAIVFSFQGKPITPFMNLFLYFYFLFYFISIPLIIIFTILAICTYFKYRKKAVLTNNAMKLLYERYAKGEITKEQFEQIKKDFEG